MLELSASLLADVSPVIDEFARIKNRRSYLLKQSPPPIISGRFFPGNSGSAIASTNEQCFCGPYFLPAIQFGINGNALKPEGNTEQFANQ